MIELVIIPDAEGAYPEANALIPITSIGRLPLATREGQAAVIVEITTPSGQKVYGHTTLRLFKLAHDTIVSADNASPSNPTLN